MRTPFPLTFVRGRDIPESVFAQMRDALLRTFARFRPAPVISDAVEIVPREEGGREEGAVLRFPIRGEALLANLANTLRERFLRSTEQGDDPFLLMLSRTPRPRLSIDRDAYVEFHTEDDTFHLKIDAAPASRMTLETTEFTTLVKFVLQYLAERHGGETLNEGTP